MLRRSKRTEGTFRDGDRVVVNIDLPGVRAGSRGVVVGVSGLDWIRYRVEFENGVVRNLIDAGRLEPSRQPG